MILAVSTLAIVLIAVGAVLLFLFVGGLIANTLRRRADAKRLRAQIDEANRALAEAHAQDKGWERESLEAGARSVFEARHPGAAIDHLHLVQVVDRPGTESDLAVFHVHGAGRLETITLGRRDDAWVPAEEV